LIFSHLLSLGERAAQTGVFGRSAAFEDSSPKMLRASPGRRPAGLAQPRRRQAGRSPSPCGPKPPSGDGAVGVGPKALGLPSEAFAQAGRRAKSTRSMLLAFDFSVAPRLPLSWPTPQHRLLRYAVAGPQVTPGWEDDAAMLATAASRLGRGTTGPKSGQGCGPQSGHNVSSGRQPEVPEFGENDLSRNSGVNEGPNSEAMSARPHERARI
jgi:hypothetical protein